MPVSARGNSARFQSFIDAVIKPFKVSVKGASYSYLEYLALPAAVRSNDEADVVDVRFTESALEWLGFRKTEGHYKYNTTSTTPKTESWRPDFVTFGTVGNAFVWEDKNTTEEFDEDYLAKLRQYTAGSAGYAVWSNARQIIGLRFDAKGQCQQLVEVDVKSLAEYAGSDEKTNKGQVKTQVSALELFYVLFSRDRFTLFESLLNKVCIDEKTFLDQARLLIDAGEREEFIAGARQVLEHLRLAALQSITLALRHQEDIPNKEATLRKEWTEKKRALVDNYLSAAVTLEKRQSLKNAIDSIELRLGVMSENELSAEDFEGLCKTGSKRLSATDRAALQTWLKNAKSINGALRKLRLESVEPRRVADAFQVWAERQPIADLVSPDIFAEQVAYVVFVRLLLARVLEDKGLLDRRIASDGGLTAWREIVVRYLGPAGGTIHADSFLSLLSESLSRYYRHFFQQPVFDWFKPDDYLLVETLEFLNRYNFKAIESDLLGFTYEEYIDRVARNKKGHFLTRPEVVDYMLDLAGYSEVATLGRRLLDPACGSGSFLVHGLRRYREALISAICQKNSIDRAQALNQDVLRQEIAQQTLQAATNLFYGMDIDPFPCYLAELNILIQLLEDLHYLWKKGISCSIERFHIYTTDSLALPASVLGSTTAAADNHDFPRDLAEDVVDETFVIKAKSGDYGAGFSYVISNPPYINRRQEELGADYASYPFFSEALSGDTNTYLLFLRLGMHYLAQAGTLCFIVPLTILGDLSGKAIRSLFTSSGFMPAAITRFYTGNVLFPGIDQATSIICAMRRPVEVINVAGGETIAQAKETQAKLAKDVVISAYHTDMHWRPWLVSPDTRAYHTWEQAKQLNGRLSKIIDAWFETRQGDVNATHANPFRVGPKSALGPKEVPLFKGQSISRYSLLPSKPEDILLPKATEEGLPSNQARVNQELHRLLSLSVPERGVVMRQVARLNTRYELIATRFDRIPPGVFAFENSLWRFLAKSHVSSSSVDAFLGLVCSRAVAYLVNLFSTNNHIALEELGAIPTPDCTTLPEKEIAELARKCLDTRQTIELQFLRHYEVVVPESGQDFTLSADKVLQHSSTPTISLNDAILIGLVKSLGSGKIGTLLRNDKITLQGKEDFNGSARLLLVAAADMIWTDALSNLRLPEPSVAGHWLDFYSKQCSEAKKLWNEFLNLQSGLDEVVFDWYGFDTVSRDAIREGLPWATR